MEYSSERPTDMSRERLIQELKDTREQLRKQKTLKEMYINRGKETTRELERLRKYSHDVTHSYSGEGQHQAEEEEGSS